MDLVTALTTTKSASPIGGLDFSRESESRDQSRDARGPIPVVEVCGGPRRRDEELHLYRGDVRLRRGSDAGA